MPTDIITAIQTPTDSSGQSRSAVLTHVEPSAEFAWVSQHPTLAAAVEATRGKLPRLSDEDALIGTASRVPSLFSLVLLDAVRCVLDGRLPEPGMLNILDAGCKCFEAYTPFETLPEKDEQ